MYIYIFIICVYIYILHVICVCVGVLSFIDVARHPSPTPLFSCQPHLFIPAIDCHGIHELILQNCLGQLQAYTVQSLGHGNAWYTYTLRWICPHLAFTNPVGASGACKVTDTKDVVMVIPRRLSKHTEQKTNNALESTSIKTYFLSITQHFFLSMQHAPHGWLEDFYELQFSNKKTLVALICWPGKLIYHHPLAI